MNRSVPTQRDLARHLGISHQAVSFALAGRPGVSESLRQRVHDAARLLGYDPEANRLARVMVARRDRRVESWGVVAVVVPSLVQGLSVDAYFGDIVIGIERESQPHDLDLVLCYQRADGHLNRLIRSRQVDGVILLAKAVDVAARMRSLNLRMVSVDMELPGTMRITSDGAEGIAAMVHHLIGLGHRNMAYLGLPDDGAPGRERRLAMRAAAGARLVCDVSLAGLSDEQIRAGADRLLDAGHGGLPATALVCYNDRVALIVMAQLRDRGWRIPEDISITGMDDLQESSAAGLSTVGFDRQAMGRQALLLAIGAQAAPPSGIVRMPVVPLTRTSTGIPPT